MSAAGIASISVRYNTATYKQATASYCIPRVAKASCLVGRFSWVFSPPGETPGMHTNRVFHNFCKTKDICGRKMLLCVSFTLFVLFSAGCGAAQTLTQLIVCRAFQGVGGTGCWDLSLTMSTELVPRERYLSTALLPVVFTIYIILGPILGGFISSSTPWSDVAASNIARVPFISCTLPLLATLSLVAAVAEPGLSFQWRSAFVISLLVVSGILWVSFLLWERLATANKTGTSPEPVVPWRFAANRVWLGMLMNTVFVGGPWNGIIIQLPQRFQVVNGESTIGAGVRLLPFTATAPIESIITAVLAKKGVVPIYMLVFGSVLQTIGFALLGSLSTQDGFAISLAQYGYQTMVSLGSGSNNSLLALLTPFSVEPRDKGVITQFRIMGGAVGLSIINTVMHGYLKPSLHDTLSKVELDAVLKSAQALAALSPDHKEVTREVLLAGYNLQMKILPELVAIQILGSALMW
ncbi:MFS general substrate transporter [Lentithecium fluviatile CBS 122367]|uniref:MFS general substrate transporter n=1 Tax=Lentithecium fluviatile CBS 122367 TaxID=1168545 RepID=A0A6G1ITS0_9PLEO|nr:MFS general substrate transporter [Lentithecium fluviatile CBS 122367]